MLVQKDCSYVLIETKECIKTETVLKILKINVGIFLIKPWGWKWWSYNLFHFVLPKHESHFVLPKHESHPDNKYHPFVIQEELYKQQHC